MRHGIARWLGRPDHEDLRDGTALLQIVTASGTENRYWVSHNEHETQMRKIGKKADETYACNIESGWCECPDHTQRKTLCKHVKALRAALHRIK